MLKKAYKLKRHLAPALYYYPNQPRAVLENELEGLLQEPLDPKHKEMISFQKRIINIEIISLPFSIIRMYLLIIMLRKEQSGMSRSNKKYPDSSKY
jgi:hypothetical protein